MNKILKMAILAGLGLTALSANAANTPADVGDVTLTGSITAAKPSWQWTVNNYSGAALNASIDNAVTDDATGEVTYTLNGSPFIAVSGYIPGSTPLLSGLSFEGYTDKTSLKSNGNPIEVTYGDDGISTFEILATNGQDVQGTLTLRATEIRGRTYVMRDVNPDLATYNIILPSASGDRHLIEGGSCFVGMNKITGTYGGTISAPTAPADLSSTAFTAFNAAMVSANEGGSITLDEFMTMNNVTSNEVGSYTANNSNQCDVAAAGTAGNFSGGGNQGYKYVAAAHILELTPSAVRFPQPVTGSWSATLTVEAYQM